MLNFEGKREWLRENISLPNSSCLDPVSLGIWNLVSGDLDLESKTVLDSLTCSLLTVVIT